MVNMAAVLEKSKQSEHELAKAAERELVYKKDLEDALAKYRNELQRADAACKVACDCGCCLTNQRQEELEIEKKKIVEENARMMQIQVLFGPDPCNLSRNMFTQKTGRSRSSSILRESKRSKTSL